MTASVVAIANQKGGVGKTTTAINLAASLAGRQSRVLLIDLDPQGNASTGLGVSRDARADGTYGVLLGKGHATSIVHSSTDNLDVLPAGPELAGAEVELVNQPDREYRLKKAMPHWCNHYDVIFIDCPPSLGLLTLNGLVAADGVLVPLQCEFFALEGLGHFTRTLDLIRRGPNPALRLMGIVLTMFDRRNNLSTLVAADARSFFGGKVYQTVIPRNVRISEASSHGKPLIDYDAKSSGSLAYERLADEILPQVTTLKAMAR